MDFIVRNVEVEYMTTPTWKIFQRACVVFNLTAIATCEIHKMKIYSMKNSLFFSHSIFFHLFPPKFVPDSRKKHKNEEMPLIALSFSWHICTHHTCMRTTYMSVHVHMCTRKCTVSSALLCHSTTRHYYPLSFLIFSSKCI